ncbi:putative ribonuclease H-like domain-containing protein [Tanacetum coccineum]
MKSSFKTLNTDRQSSSRVVVSVNTARPINTAYTRSIVNSARPTSNVFNIAHSHVRRPFNKYTTNKNSNFNEKVNTVRENITTVRPKAVGNPQLELQEKRVINSGCSRHMTGNKSYLSDYKEINGGFGVFGGNSKGGTIESIDAGQAGKKKVPSHEYILLPLWTPGSPISSSLKSSDDKVTYDVKKKTTEDQAKVDDKDDHDLREFERLIVQGKEAKININNTNSVSAISSLVNTAGTKDVDVNNTNSIYTASLLVNFDGLSYFNANPPDDPKMHNLEDTGIFGGAYDDEDFVAGGDMNNLESSMLVSPIATIRVHKDHPVEQIIGNLYSAPQTRRMTKNSEEHGLMSLIQKQRRTNHKDFQNCLFAYFLSQVEPKKKVWTLVDLPYGKRAIGTKWVYRNKKDERGIVVRNKARLVAQGYTQEEGIDYDEVFAPVAKIEAIRLFLAYASFMNFVVYQMDVNSAFLYDNIKEEVYVCQPLGFEDPEFPDRVYKVEKALYGLHQAPRAWYETLSTYLLENRFQRGTIDKTLLIKKVKGDILLVQIYVDDIIFESTKKELCTEFEKLMHKKFQMSSIGELTFFLGLQVMQKEDGIFISQDKYMDEILKKFGFSTARIASTPMETLKPLFKDAETEDVDVHIYRSMIGSLMYLTFSRPDIIFAVCACARFQVTPKVSHLHAVKRIFKYLKGQPKLALWYPKDSPFDLEAYTDSDYAGASLDRKSITEGCQFIGSRLISWQCKKQTVVANSTTEAEYVAASNYCGSPRRQDTILGDRPAQTRFERLSKHSNDLPLLRVNTLGSGEDNMKLKELIELCIKLSERVLVLENIKTAQDLEITNLKKRDAETQGRYGHDVSTVDVTTASVPSDVDVSAASPIRPVDDSITDDITLVETLMKIKSTKDKGKGIMQEPEKPVKVKDKYQIEYDADVAQRLQAELDEEARLEREIVEEASKAANIAEWDDVQAMMDADYELAAKLQMLFEKEMKRVNIFVDTDAKLVKGRETREESGSKRAGDELEQKSSKRQKVDDDDKERRS